MTTTAIFSSLKLAIPYSAKGGALIKCEITPQSSSGRGEVSTSLIFANILANLPKAQASQQCENPLDSATQLPFSACDISRNRASPIKLDTTEPSLLGFLPNMSELDVSQDSEITSSDAHKHDVQVLNKNAALTLLPINTGEILPLNSPLTKRADPTRLTLDTMAMVNTEGNRTVGSVQNANINDADIPTVMASVNESYEKGAGALLLTKRAQPLQEQNGSNLPHAISSHYTTYCNANPSQVQAVLGVDLGTDVNGHSPLSVAEKASATRFDDGKLLGHSVSNPFSEPVEASLKPQIHIGKKTATSGPYLKQNYPFLDKPNLTETLVSRLSVSELVAEIANCGVNGVTARSLLQDVTSVDPPTMSRERLRLLVGLSSKALSLNALLMGATTFEEKAAPQHASEAVNGEKRVKSAVMAAFANASRSNAIHVALQNIESGLKIYTRAGRLTDLDRDRLRNDIIALMAQYGSTVTSAQVQIDMTAKQVLRGANS